MKKFRIITALAVVLVIAASFAYNVFVKVSRIALEDFNVRGVDVSAYQGKIDWKKIEEQGIDFAFIKASEGSTYKDRLFDKNAENIAETSVAAGAYHFLSFESDGKSQAENFISAVGENEFALAPVIDVELYGDYVINPPPSSEIRKILDEMVSELYAQYGRYPIIYTNRRAYLLYISGEYKNCDLWICDLIKLPGLPDGREWKFWQYSHTATLDGYVGDEKHIDMNVFNGSKKDFERYVRGE